MRSNCAVLSSLLHYGETPQGAAIVGDVPFKLVRVITQTRGARDHWENTRRTCSARRRSWTTLGSMKKTRRALARSTWPWTMRASAAPNSKRCAYPPGPSSAATTARRMPAARRRSTSTDRAPAVSTMPPDSRIHSRIKRPPRPMPAWRCTENTAYNAMAAGSCSPRPHPQTQRAGARRCVSVTGGGAPFRRGR